MIVSRSAVKLFIVAAGLLLLLCATGGVRAAEADSGRSLGTSNEAKACLNCHDEPHVTTILHTAHTVNGDARTGIAEQGCQNCHGNSEAHLSKPADGKLRASPGVVFSEIGSAHV